MPNFDSVKMDGVDFGDIYDPEPEPARRPPEKNIKTTIRHPQPAKKIVAKND